MHINLKKSDIVHIAVFSLLILAAFANVFSMEFVWDDTVQIRDNTSITNISHIKEVFFEDTGTATTNGEDYTPYYRPLFTISLMIDAFLWGKNPFGYHLTNVLLHLEVTLLLYFSLLLIFNNRMIAMVAAAIFSLHPVHSEAVSYISARTHLLCALFSLASFYFYVCYKKVNNLRYLLATIFFIIFALLSNEMAVSLPAIFLLYEICIEKRNRRSFFYPACFFILTLTYVILRFIILHNYTWVDLPVKDRTLTGFDIIIRYLRLLILPVGLKVFYEIPLQKDFFNIHLFITFLLLIFHICLGYLFWKWSKPLFFGLLWIFVTLLPVSNIPAVIYPSLLAERYLYLPSVGFAIMTGLVIFYAFEHIKDKYDIERYIFFRRFSYGAGVFLAICLIFLSLSRNAPYKSDLELWKTAVSQEHSSIYSHYRLALAYEESGKLENAKDELEYVFKKNPQKIIQDRIIYLYHRLGLTDAQALYRIGVLYLDNQMYNSATVCFLKSVKNDDKMAEAHNALGISYFEQGLYSEAVAEFRKAVKLNPYNPGYLENLTNAENNLANIK